MAKQHPNTSLILANGWLSSYRFWPEGRWGKRKSKLTEERSQATLRQKQTHNQTMVGGNYLHQSCVLLNNFSVSQTRFRLLDVGALTNNYLTESWFQVDAIDLNPQHPSVTKADFFDYTRSIALNGRGAGPMSAKGKEKSGEEKDDSTTNLKQKYDVVVLSLVLNFVGDPRQRGEMLMRCSRIIVEGGYLFLVLPLACITNSRYLDHSLFVRLMKKLRFDLHSHKESNKLCFYIFRRQGGATKEEAEEANFGKRALCKGGKERNNFCILLQSQSGGGKQLHKDKNKGKKGNNKQNVKRGKGRQTK